MLTFELNLNTKKKTYIVFKDGVELLRNLTKKAALVIVNELNNQMEILSNVQSTATEPGFTLSTRESRDSKQTRATDSSDNQQRGNRELGCPVSKKGTRDPIIEKYIEEEKERIRSQALRDAEYQRSQALRDAEYQRSQALRDARIEEADREIFDCIDRIESLDAQHRKIYASSIGVFGGRALQSLEPETIEVHYCHSTID